MPPQIVKPLLLLGAALVLSGSGLAQNVPNLISYQGRASDAAGLPVGNAAPVNRVVIFRVWDSPSATGAANRLYSERQNVTVSGGEFSVLLGAGTPVSGDTGNAFTTFSAAVFAGATAYLGVTIDDGDGNLTNDPESSPRQQIVASVFAFRAQVAVTVAPGGVTSAALADNSILGAALAAGAVTTTKLANGAVLTAALGDASVTAAKLASIAVTTTALADGAITATKLATGTFDGAKFADGAVALAKVRHDSVNSARIVDGSIATADLATGAVETAKLADGAVTLAKRAAASVDSNNILDGSVALADLAPNSIDSSKFAGGAVGLPQLSSVVRDGIPKPGVVYDQAVFPALEQKGHILIPIDIEVAANDDDGCKIEVIMQNKNTGYAYDFRRTSFWITLERPDFYAVNSGYLTGVIAGRTRAIMDSLVYSWNFKLGLTSWSQGYSYVGDQADFWIRFYNAYPGSLRSGEAAPFNANQDNTGSNQNAGGPEASFNVKSVTAGTNTLTVTLDNPHAIQVNDTVTLANISGTPSPNRAGTSVTAVPDRMSFTVELAGATGSYSGGSVLHKPTYSKFRIWAAVHPHVAARIIVYDR